ncbi:helix-turn-helix transcriptional regulator [Rhizobium leguminosarum]|uniref:helix-turn-helix transcriptional regulator n=1 Tax=Rhizobium leguminosarum TaxID=384 RepID=UPI001AEA8F58|nr:helix-turn-helix transcriptional regulator [Rhizobium leguminosarum]MBP2444828.1 AraC family transcriptional regulator [Rhizobium leguminosarum]
MRKQRQTELADISTVRSHVGGWPISTAGMSSTSRGLHFDVRDVTHGVEMIVPACDHHAVLVALGSSRQFRFHTNVASREVSCRAGDIIVVPSGSPARFGGAVPPILRIGIDPEQLSASSSLTASIRGKDDHTGSILYANDTFALFIGGAIIEEMRRPEAEWRVALLRHLAEALTVHFVTRYGVHTVSEYTGEISDREAIRRLIEQLGRTTRDFPDVAALAKKSGLSHFHFIRVFKSEIGMTPGRYVEQCKMEHVKSMIEMADSPLADIAEMLGFADQSHLTRRFKTIVGCTPAAYARAHGRRAAASIKAI